MLIAATPRRARGARSPTQRWPAGWRPRTPRTARRPAATCRRSGARSAPGPLPRARRTPSRARRTPPAACAAPLRPAWPTRPGRTSSRRAAGATSGRCADDDPRVVARPWGLTLIGFGLSALGFRLSASCYGLRAGILGVDYRNRGREAGMTITDGGARILIVDDDRALRHALAALLRDAGYRVTQAADGASALAMLEEEPAELVLLDVGLPGMDGLDVLRALRQRPLPPSVVMMTADDTPRTLLGAIRGQAYRYIR